MRTINQCEIGAVFTNLAIARGRHLVKHAAAAVMANESDDSQNESNISYDARPEVGLWG